MNRFRQPPAATDSAESSGPAVGIVEDGLRIDLVRSTINGLFAAGLDLCAARAMADGDAADRIDRAIGELDDAIAGLRSRSFEFGVIDLTEHRSATSVVDR